MSSAFWSLKCVFRTSKRSPYGAPIRKMDVLGVNSHIVLPKLLKKQTTIVNAGCEKRGCMHDAVAILLHNVQDILHSQLQHQFHGPRMTASRIWKTSITGTATTVFYSNPCSWAHRELRPAFFHDTSRNDVSFMNVNAAWDGMVTTYQSSTRQRRRELKQELTQMVMSEGHD